MLFGRKSRQIFYSILDFYCCFVLLANNLYRCSDLPVRVHRKRHLTRIKHESIIYVYKLHSNIKVSIKWEIESAAETAQRNLFPLKPEGGRLDFSRGCLSRRGRGIPRTPVGCNSRWGVAMKLYTALSEAEYALINSMTSQDCLSLESFIFCPRTRLGPQFHFCALCALCRCLSAAKSS